MQKPEGSDFQKYMKGLYIKFPLSSSVVRVVSLMYIPLKILLSKYFEWKKYYGSHEVRFSGFGLAAFEIWLTGGLSFAPKSEKIRSM